MIKNLSGSGQKVHRAQILWKEDIEGANWIGSSIAEAYNCRRQTVENLCYRLVEDVFDVAFSGKKRACPSMENLLDVEQEAQIILLRLGISPTGYNNWSLRFLAYKVVKLGIVETVNHETVCQTLKKRHE